VLWGFAPRTTDAPPGSDDDLYDIVITTDVLSEGVNLQQARHIIDYDLPWNPMRLVQRHGRIDRIGSTHSEVFLRCVFPDAQLDDLLGLEQRLHRKIEQAAAAVGTGEILPGSKSTDVIFTETREEIERLRAEDATLFVRSGTGRGTLSGEQFRQELRQAFENPELEHRIRALPWGSGSGMLKGSWPHAGYVFCVRVADHDRAIFRYVAEGEPTTVEVIDDTLACLDLAHPEQGFDTERVLDDETYRRAFDAWTVARDSVLEAWNRASDPANLAPAIPKAMMRAAELVRTAKPPEMSIEASEHLIEALEAPYPERVVRTIRVAMGSHTDALDQVRAVEQIVADLGLEPSPPPEPLPQISASDIHLVCWLALVPSGSRVSRGT